MQLGIGGRRGDGSLVRLLHAEVERLLDGVALTGFQVDQEVAEDVALLFKKLGAFLGLQGVGLEQAIHQSGDVGTQVGSEVLQRHGGVGGVQGVGCGLRHEFRQRQAATISRFPEAFDFAGRESNAGLAFGHDVQKMD